MELQVQPQTCRRAGKARWRWSPARPSAGQDWRELGVAGLLMLLAGLLLSWGARLGAGLQLGLWAGWLLLTAIAVRAGWLRLFGPLLGFELIALARRRRYLLLRVLYAGSLLLLLATLYFYSTWNWPAGQNPPSREMTRFADLFFFTFMCAEFLAVLVLTPAYTAGAIASEKDNGTLEFLLATDLLQREIVLSKLGARTLNMALVILVALPILSFVQFFGGIDPNLVLMGFGVLGLTLLSLAALSILCSVYARKSRSAIVLTYFATGAYLGVGWLTNEHLPEVPELADLAVSLPWQGGWVGVSVQQLADAANAGNIAVALRRLADSWNKNQALTALLPGVVRRYAVFHSALFVVATGWSILRLRALASPPAGNGVP